MKCDYACGSNQHNVNRRMFLGTVAGTGLSVLANPLSAKQLASQQKRVLMVFLAGGVSQLETWDPKPGTNTGGESLGFYQYCFICRGNQTHGASKHAGEKRIHDFSSIAYCNEKEV